MTFNDLNLIEPILQALKTEGYTIPTPIQARAIPHILNRKDVLGCAQTGTGKTAAFAIPMLQLMHESAQVIRGKRVIKSLILTPTRELALQIGESFTNYGKNTRLSYNVVFGGVNQHSQVEKLKAGVDILVATPGRLLDLMQQGYVNLKNIEYFVLDEADRMLDMGFLKDVKRIIAQLPVKRQSLFFSATMPRDIVELANTILVNPVKVEVTPSATTVDIIQQFVYFVDKKNKIHLLKDLMQEQNIDRALVFTRTKHGADRVARDLTKAGIRSLAIHGNKSQNARQAALAAFKESKTRVLVATDIAARGIDIDDLSHVINYELPNIAESYVHRIGRTGRAGADGKAIAFCDTEEKEYLKDIQKLIGKKVTEVEGHGYPLMIHTVEKKIPQQRSERPRNGRNGSSGKAKNGSSQSKGFRNNNENQNSGNRKRSFRKEVA
jgi:ATP-dependent RNA helicase RhlE